MFLRQVKHTPQGGGKTVDNLLTSENWGDFMGPDKAKACHFASRHSAKICHFVKHTLFL